MSPDKIVPLLYLAGLFMVKEVQVLNESRQNCFSVIFGMIIYCEGLFMVKF